MKMSDIFLGSDVRQLFGSKLSDNGCRVADGKSILMIGDSLMRCLYKDLIHLSREENQDTLTPVESYKRCRERQFEGDYLLNLSEEDLKGRDFREQRDFYDEDIDMQFSFIFVTRCFSDYLEDLLRNYPKQWGSYPDLIVMNSALWDINRWGGRGIEMFRENMQDLIELFQSVLPMRTQMIWMTTPPISVDIRGGFQLPHLDFQRHSMRFNVMESNVFAANLVAAAGYDVLDMHYYCKDIIFRRAAGDGIHWNPDAVRYQSNILLTHYCLSQSFPLPVRWRQCLDDAQIVENINLLEAIKMAEVADEEIHNPVDQKQRDVVSERSIKVARRRL